VRIVDRDGRLIAILGGRPKDERWERVQAEAQEHLQEALDRLEMEKGCSHRRGQFSTLSCGVSHGGGQTRPMNMQNRGRKKEVLADLNSKECFKRFASFGSCGCPELLIFTPFNGLLAVFQSCAPKLHEYYAKKLRSLFEHDSSLCKPFNSVFTAATYNLGPQVVCYPHVDFANLPFGLCAITAIGDFNPLEGGHLVLWDCKLAIEFPPGSTVLILSAVLIHSNSKIAAHETRFSFSQYSAGGLFRWVDHGFQSVVSYRALLTKEECGSLDARNQERWELGLNLLPKIKPPSPA
jgi:hypothetical protein